MVLLCSLRWRRALFTAACFYLRLRAAAARLSLAAHGLIPPATHYTRLPHLHSKRCLLLPTTSHLPGITCTAHALTRCARAHHHATCLHLPATLRRLCERGNRSALAGVLYTLPLLLADGLCNARVADAWPSRHIISPRQNNAYAAGILRSDSWAVALPPQLPPPHSTTRTHTCLPLAAHLPHARHFPYTAWHSLPRWWWA